MSWAVVIPSNRTDRLATFVAAWRDLLNAHNAELFVVHDEPATWVDLPAWVPRRSDMIRSWGFIRAWRSGAEYVLTLDDDVAPLDDMDPFEQYEEVFRAGAPHSAYLSVGALTSTGLQMRGFPFADRKPATVAVQYGGWWGVPDLDAPTQLAAPPDGDDSFSPVVLPVPAGAPVTTCIMNAAWRRDVTILMWQLPLVDGRYNRWGDIWSGLLQKAALDAAGEVMVINGYASVHHQRASDPVVNLTREAPGIPVNEGLWDTIRDAVRAAGDISRLDAWITAGDALAGHVRSHGDGEWADEFLSAREAWLSELHAT